MDNKIQDIDNQNSIVTENQFKQFQSFYYLLKGKRDTDIKLFDENKQFSYSDILDLNEKINRKLELHQIITSIVNITVGFDNKEIKSFCGWNEFKNTDWNTSAKTKYIVLEWDFNIILPNQKHPVPQTHTLRLRIGNNLKPSEMIQVVFQGDEDCDIEEMQSEMVCKIDFVNSQICTELKSVVISWYDSLNKNIEENKLIRWVIKNHNIIQSFVIFFFLTASIVLINYLFIFLSISNFKLIPSNIEQRQFFFITCGVPIIYLFYTLGNFYAEKIHRKTIHKIKRNPMFYVTKGDKNKKEEVEKSNKKILNKLAREITVSIIMNIGAYLIGIFLNYIK